MGFLGDTEGPNDIQRLNSSLENFNSFEMFENDSSNELLFF